MEREKPMKLYPWSKCEWWSYGDCYVEYISVRIQYMLDSIIGFGHNTTEIYFFGVSAQLVSAQNEIL